MTVKKQILRLYIIFSRFERQEISERYQNTWNLELDELNIALSSYITFWVEIKFLNGSVSNFKFFFATQSCSRQWNNFLDYQAFVRYGQKSNEWVDFVEVVRYYIVSIEGGMGGGGRGGQKGGQKFTTLKTSQKRANSNSTCSHTKLFSYVITTAIKFDKVISYRHA